MPDAGSMYYNALSGFGNDMANAMYQYHKEHQSYDQAYGVADALSRIGVDPSGRIVAIQPDADGKVDKNIQPIVDPKALEMFQTGNRRDWARSAGALEALSRLGAQFANRASEQNITPRYPVNTGDRIIPATAGQAIQSDLEQQRIEAATKAGAVREARAQRTEARQERRAALEEKRFGLSQAREARTELDKRPEREFSRKYGLTPQSLIGLQESRYVAKSAAGQTLGETDPLPAGVTAKEFPSAAPWWKEAITLGLAKPDPSKPQSVKWEAQNADGQVFRESKFDYPGSAKQGVPKRERFLVNPEGEFLNVRGTRIPLDEVSRIQNTAMAVRSELLEKFKAKPQLLPAFRERLSTLGYDPYDPFWGLPQQ